MPSSRDPHGPRSGLCSSPSGRLGNHRGTESTRSESLSQVLHVTVCLPAPTRMGPADTHVALDREDLGPELLDAHVEISDLAAAALEAAPKLCRAGGLLLQLEGNGGSRVRVVRCGPPSASCPHPLLSAPWPISAAPLHACLPPAPAMCLWVASAGPLLVNPTAVPASGLVLLGASTTMTSRRPQTMGFPPGHSSGPGRCPAPIPAVKHPLWPPLPTHCLPYTSPLPSQRTSGSGAESDLSHLYGPSYGPEGAIPPGMVSPKPGSVSTPQLPPGCVLRWRHTGPSPPPQCHSGRCGSDCPCQRSLTHPSLGLPGPSAPGRAQM